MTEPLFYTGTAALLLFRFQKPLCTLYFKLNGIFRLDKSVLLFSRYSLTVFLFHPFCFLLSDYLLTLLNLAWLPDTVLLFYFFAMAFSGSLALIFFMGWTQKLRIFRF